MFRHLRFFSRYRGGALLLLWMIATAATVMAAPISGSFQVDLVMHPVSCGVDEDGDTFVDEDPPDGIDNDGDTLIDEDGCRKVDKIKMKFEADLSLQLNISGVQINTTTVFTFKGLEYQEFVISSVIGAISVKDLLVFAPSVTEIEEVRTVSTLARRYCVSAAAPADVTPPLLDCPVVDSVLYWLLEDPNRFHPAVANLRLATIFDSAGMLDPALVLRKKIAELTVNIAGMSLGARLLFANLGSATAPAYRVGSVLALEGQTVSGIVLRTESWIGARQGLECFAECKPVERLYEGIVVDSFSIQEEKLFISNLVLGGVTFNLKTEFHFVANPSTYCPIEGICYVEINTRARLSPLGLIVENTMRLNSSLGPASDSLKTQLKFGDVSITAIWYFYLADTNTWESQIAEFISVFDPPGVTITSDLRVCTEQLFSILCSLGKGALQHDIFVNAATGNLSWTARVSLLGLIADFYQFSADMSWTVGAVTFTGAIVLSAESLDALAFGTRVRF
ncbi:hypothetical protein HYR54_01485 [Candidatus Acetothermia bacterium]|nr:hypothetical protein [Candidatus Acetothermia bacterium]MBI3459897.1 hypothetical protein [Candidatus Acetothermia bacterium]